MADPARQYPHHEAGSRSATAPLRDWLAQIRAQTAVEAQQQEQPAEPTQAERPSWAPRVVPQREEPAAPAQAAPVAESAQDISELMAENMLLKAQLRLEGDRYAELQAMLAADIRELRSHVETEMKALEDIREERDLWQARAEALAQPLFQKR